MSRTPSVALLDYGSGNVHSVAKALTAAGAEVRLTADPAEVRAADGLLVPGVGAYAAVMAQLRAVGGPELIAERLGEGAPVLGICVGLQVLFASGEERGVTEAGLGYWPGTVGELTAPVLPHMGWNTVAAAEGSALFDGVAEERFYFVHSNAATAWSVRPRHAAATARVTWADHGGAFIAAVEDGPLSATQFHPEKSGAAGIRLLRNWLSTLG